MSRTARESIVIAVVAIAALLPLVAGPDREAAAAQALLLLVAAIGLNWSVGYAGEPSLGQGAFAGLGAYTAALLRAKAGWDPVGATLVAVLVAGIAGELVARSVAPLRAAFVALVTWLGAWTFAFAVSAFGGFTGGSAGTIVPQAALHLRALGINTAVSPAAWYEIALVSALLALGATVALARRFEPAAAAARGHAGVALAIGIDVPRLRHGALVASAIVGGFAGALYAQVAGVADPTAYGPVLSVKLFVVVLLGGAGTLLGPVVGLVTLAAVSGIAGGIATLAGGSSARVEPIAAGVALVGVVVLGGGGVVPALRRRFRLPRLASGGDEPALSIRRGVRLRAEDLTVTYDGLRALDGVSLQVAAGSCHAVVGPNGSGKSTLLRALGGAALLASGRVALSGGHLDEESPSSRVRLGVARTFQRNAIVDDQTALAHVIAGMEARRSITTLQALLRTPGARSEETTTRVHALGALARVGLRRKADVPAASLFAFEQRALQIARALASSPRVLLLDEPSAGAGSEGERRLRDIIAGLRDDGLTIVLVEHNLRLVRALADRVTVLDAGRVIAEGTVDEIALDEGVRSAYLGDARLGSPR